MKATDQYFHVVLFIMLHKVVLTLSLRMKPQCVTIQMKAIEQYFHIYYAVQGGSNSNFKSEDETLVCDHSNESY